MTFLSNPVRRRAAGAAGAALASVLILTACGPSGGGNAQGGGDATGKPSNAEVAMLNVGQGGSVRNLDQAASYDTNNYPIVNLLIEGLMTYTPTGQLVPKLAKSVDHPNDLTYVYTLRDGLKFWNGDPVTAEDAAFSLERNLDPDVASVLGGYYSNVKDVVASGPNKVTMTLKTVDPFSQYIPAFSGGVVEKKFVEAAGKDFGTSKGLTMGTGPYKVVSYSPAGGVELKRNEDYWGDKPTVAAIKFTQIEDPEALRLAMQSGEIDVATTPQTETFNLWDKMDGVNMIYTDAFYLQYLSLETNADPWDDVHVRRAIAYASNPKGLLNPLFSGHADLSKSPILESAWANLPKQKSEIEGTYKDLTTYQFDMHKAAEELAKSDHPDGFEVTVPYPAQPTYLGRTLENLKQNLAKIHVTLDLKEIPGQKWGDDIWANPQGIGMQIEQFGLDYPDPGNFPAVALGKANNHPESLGTAKFSTPELEKLLEQQRSTTDPAERAKALTGIVKIVADEVPVVPLYHTYDALALSDKFVYDGEFSHWTFVYGDWATHIKAAK